MTTPAANDRALDGLYAALSPLERNRLFARLWRQHDTRELQRLVRTIPDTAAGRAYNRAAAIVRHLHGSTMPELLALKNGIDLDLWRLLHAYDLAADRSRARSLCYRLWDLLAYPVTESEYRRLVAIERDEPTPLDAYAELLAEREGDEEGLHPEIAKVLCGMPDDLARLHVPDDHPPGEPPPDERWREDVRRSREIAALLRAVIDAAIARGELPTPEPLDGEPALPWGVLHDWGEGTTPETYEPYPPTYHVPAIEVMFGLKGNWDVRPDSEADAVKERRGKLLDVFVRIAEDACDATEEDLRALSLEPPATREERERAAAAVADLSFWGVDRLREDLRLVTAQHAIRRAELWAYRDAIDRLQQEVFGGEDPLDPFVRALLGDTWATEERFAETWAKVTEALKPGRFDEDQDWPPPFEDEAHYERTLPHLEEHLRTEWDE